MDGLSASTRANLQHTTGFAFGAALSAETLASRPSLCRRFTPWAERSTARATSSRCRWLASQSGSSPRWARGTTNEKRGNLLGTNHEATEVAYLKDGRTLARGTLWHNPDFRRPDHRRVPLAKGRWHVIVKNTVPMSA